MELSGGPLADKALIFCIDADGRVRTSREVEFVGRADLIRQLQPELDRHPIVEAWAGSVCLLRNRQLPALALIEEADF